MRAASTTASFPAPNRATVSDRLDYHSVIRSITLIVEGEDRIADRLRGTASLALRLRRDGRVDATDSTSRTPTFADLAFPGWPRGVVPWLRAWMAPRTYRSTRSASLRPASTRSSVSASAGSHSGASDCPGSRWRARPTYPRSVPARDRRGRCAPHVRVVRARAVARARQRSYRAIDAALRLLADPRWPDRIGRWQRRVTLRWRPAWPE